VLTTRNRELQTLHEIGQIILNTSDVTSALQRILENTMQAGEFDIGLIRLSGPYTAVFKPAAFAGFRDAANIARKTSRQDEAEAGSTLMALINNKRAVIAEDLSAIAGLRGIKREGARSAVVVPVISGEQILGTIHLGSRTARTFTPNDIRLLETIGNQLGVAIQNFRFYEGTQHNFARIRALREIDHAITSTLDLDRVLDLLLEKISQLFPVSCAITVKLLNREGKLEPTACRNLDRDHWEAVFSTRHGVLSDLVLASKMPVIIADLSTDPRTRHLDLPRKLQLVSHLGIPLFAKGEILGRLGFYTKTQHEFSTDEIEFLTTIASQAAIAIYNSQLYEEIKVSRSQLESTNRHLERTVKELSASRDKFQKANRVKDEFLSIISHELRTPLNVIMGYAAMLQQRMFGDINGEQDNALRKLIAHSSHLTSVINNILCVTMLETGSEKLETGEVNVGDLIAQLKTAYRELSDKDIALNWDYPAELPLFELDEPKLYTVLHQLISNAIEFTNEGSVTVSVRYHEDSEILELFVQDTGTGIPNEVLPRIFDKFWQADASETRGHEGLGIGL
jgi:signal transduction histidine kinase